MFLSCGQLSCDPLIALSFCAADNMASCSMASCGSRVSAFKGTQVLSIRSAPVSRGVTAAVMVKKGIHPDWHPEAKVMCNGVEVRRHFSGPSLQPAGGVDDAACVISQCPSSTVPVCALHFVYMSMGMGHGLPCDHGRGCGLMWHHGKRCLVWLSRCPCVAPAPRR